MLRDFVLLVVCVMFVAALLGGGYLYDRSRAAECASRGGLLVKVIQGWDEAKCVKLEVLPR